MRSMDGEDYTLDRPRRTPYHLNPEF